MGPYISDGTIYIWAQVLFVHFAYDFYQWKAHG